MLNVGVPIWLRILALVGVAVGPALFVLRLNTASQMEKFVYLVVVYPIALIVLPLMYAASKKNIISDPDQQRRQDRFNELRRLFRIVMLVIVPASLIGIAITAWLLLIRLPVGK